MYSEKYYQKNQFDPCYLDFSYASQLGPPPDFGPFSAGRAPQYFQSPPNSVLGPAPLHFRNHNTIMATPDFQKLSNEWQPEVTGPLVSELLDVLALANEFAAGDPIYVQKTQALPAKFSSYRTVRGDGLCGWRAVAFSYFEILLHQNDPNKLLEERTRIESFNNLLVSTGNPIDICELFIDETLGLIDEIHKYLTAPEDDSFLLKAFNEENRSNAIITHIKLLTSSWMKTHAPDYEPFLGGQTVEEYCDQHITPIRVEIEHTGLNALLDVLVKPAGFGAEVSYLDRSPGSEINTHVLAVPESNAPSLRLLYRPGHYDILYKRPDDVNVNFVQFLPEPVPLMTDPSFMSPTNLQSWASIPGTSILPPQSFSFMPSWQEPLQTYDDQYVPDSYVPAIPSQPFYEPPLPPPQQPSTLLIRPSKYQHQAVQQPVMEPLRTKPMQNSDQNEMHHANAAFQPELYAGPEAKKPKKKKQ